MKDVPVDPVMVNYPGPKETMKSNFLVERSWPPLVPTCNSLLENIVRDIFTDIYSNNTEYMHIIYIYNFFSRFWTRETRTVSAKFFFQQQSKSGQS